MEARDCLNVLNKSNEGKELLILLMSSVYVPRQLHDGEHMLIDVGTGSYGEKTAEDAKDFFKRKTDFLTKPMEKIQPTLQEKHRETGCHGDDEPEDSAARSPGATRAAKA